MTMAATPAWATETYGPPCPCCWRDNGSHNIGCPVPSYLLEWKRIRSEQADRIADGIFGAAGAGDLHDSLRNIDDAVLRDYLAGEET